MNPVIEIKNIVFKYEDSPILDRLSFSVERGTFVSIIGPNGSGKTTLLKNMSGVLSPDSGSIFINGRDIKDYKRRELARNVAFVSQAMVPDFEFTVMDIVLMGRAPYLKPLETETPKDIEAACSAMKMTNVLDFKDKKINEISGGERQRAQIACALAQETGIILLDEPVSNLDIQHQIEILGILRKLKEDKQMTVIAVLHDLNLAAEYSDSIILIKDGEILKFGTPEDIISPSYIKRAYGTDVYMTKNPVSGKPHIIPIKNI